MDIHEIAKTFVYEIDQSPLRIAVIGDVVLDEYYSVHVSRISPEFPIQVMKSPADIPSKTCPGGAGNVAVQLTGVCEQVELFGVADKDALSHLSNRGMKLNLYTSSTPIPRKRRFYDEQFPLMRWDVESEQKEDEIKCAQKYIISALEEAILRDPFDAIILSDYDKGLMTDNFVQEIIELCQDHEIPTIVDPKTELVNKWQGCSILKPNKKEMESICAANAITPEGLLYLLKCEAIVVTNGKNEIEIYTKSKPVKKYSQAMQNDAKSVIGAGDCFSAFLAATYAIQLDILDCVKLSHLASMSYVSQGSSDPINMHQIMRYVEPEQSKIVTQETLSEILKNTRNTKTVISNGCFDLLTCAHISTLRFAKKQGDILIVAVDTDENVRKMKGETRPINTLADRMSVIAGLDCVDFVVPFSGSPADLLEKIGRIDVLVKGGDYLPDKILGRTLVGTTITAPLVAGVSTTKIVEKIKDVKNNRTSNRRKSKPTTESVPTNQPKDK